MTLTAVLAGLLAAVGINGWALYVGEDRHSTLYNAASIFGALGLVSVFIFLLAVFDAFLQIWVTRPGYEGMPVVYSLWAVALFSSASLAVALVLAWQARRGQA